MPEPTSLEREFETYAKQLGLPPFVSQYQFTAARRFRFDCCWPDQLVAVELEGGTWVNGWHNSAAGYEKDCVKYNLAAALGWRVFRFTTSMLRDDPARCLGQVMTVLEAPLNGPVVRPELSR